MYISSYKKLWLLWVDLKKILKYSLVNSSLYYILANLLRNIFATGEKNLNEEGICLDCQSSMLADDDIDIF